MGRAELFAIYFSGIAGWQMHPGYSREDSPEPLNLTECAELASAMVDITESYLCRGSLQPVQ